MSAVTPPRINTALRDYHLAQSCLVIQRRYSNASANAPKRIRRRPMTTHHISQLAQLMVMPISPGTPPEKSMT